MTVNDLDAFDRAILNILQQDNMMPQRQIGEAVGLSAPAVQRRIKRLHDNGTIAANVAVLDPLKIGNPITLIVEVELVSETAAVLDATRASFTAATEVQQCYYVTGEADFILIVAVASMADFEALTRRLFFANQNIKRFRSFVAMARHKVGVGFPL